MSVFLPASDPFVQRVMEPYAPKETVYMGDITVSAPDEGPLLEATADFGIESSCYIEDTGHFNAVEFLICYNQLMYTALAVAVRDDLHDALATWTVEEYFARQLPDVLIQETFMRFSRPIDAARFSGRFAITSMDTSRLERNILKFGTDISFTTEEGGRCRGTVLLALTNIPAACREFVEAQQ